MGRGNTSSAYRDMDEEFFTSLEEANYECHQSPAKKSKAPSESKILHKHYEQRRVVRTKVVFTLTFLLVAGVGTAALYSSVGASSWAMTMRGPYPMFRGGSTMNSDLVTPQFGEVFTSDDNTPEFGAAILASSETVTRRETEYALDDAILDELDPYDEFRQTEMQLEAN